MTDLEDTAPCDGTMIEECADGMDYIGTASINDLMWQLQYVPYLNEYILVGYEPTDEPHCRFQRVGTFCRDTVHLAVEDAFDAEIVNRHEATKLKAALNPLVSKYHKRKAA